jgi:hypothetical protein
MIIEQFWKNTFNQVLQKTMVLMGQCYNNDICSFCKNKAYFTDNKYEHIVNKYFYTKHYKYCINCYYNKNKDKTQTTYKAFIKECKEIFGYDNTRCDCATCHLNNNHYKFNTYIKNN